MSAPAAYLVTHSRRYELLLAGVAARVEAERPEPLRILDVAPSFQTQLLRERFPRARVDSLGYANPRFPSREGERHHDFDLNLAADPDRWPKPGDYELVVMGEVIEHLAVSPVAVLSCAESWLAPGGRVVVQTPNLLALHKRVRMLAGRNPLGAAASVAGPSHNPGHFREYTLAELLSVATAAGLEVEEVSINNYFRHPGRLARVYDRLTALLPPGTRQGITLYLRTPPDR